MRPLPGPPPGPPPPPPAPPPAPPPVPGGAVSAGAPNGPRYTHRGSGAGARNSGAGKASVASAMSMGAFDARSRHAPLERRVDLARAPQRVTRTPWRRCAIGRPLRTLQEVEDPHRGRGLEERRRRRPVAHSPRELRVPRLALRVAQAADRRGG